jgi:HK97 family phage prohead protease
MGDPKPDFSGWATMADVRCSDGRVILPEAFAHQDGEELPLLWAHGHTDVENVLGHVILHAKPKGIWVDAFFNTTKKGLHAKNAVQHGNIKKMSIWANELEEKVVGRDRQVAHGSMKEVSLVIAGANPGADIIDVNLEHNWDPSGELPEAAVITMPGFLEPEFIAHAAMAPEDTSSDTEETYNDVIETMTEKQQSVLWALVADAAGIEHSDLDADAEETPEGDAPSEENPEGDAPAGDGDPDKDETPANPTTLDPTTDTGDEDKDETPAQPTDAGADAAPEGDQPADESPEGDQPAADATPETDAPQGDQPEGDQPEAVHSNIFDNEPDSFIAHNQEGNTNMTRPVFTMHADAAASEGRSLAGTKNKTLTHDQLMTVVADGKRMGSFKDALLAHADEYGIGNIEYLFPDARAIDSTPELITRQMEWVTKVLEGTSKRPYSRIKSLSADVTFEAARANGYIKGTLKKKEFFELAKRETGPKTIYKMQQLDRDDIIDITELDVVTWLWAEMRLMLNEEIARAILIGDGREPDDQYKIDEDKIRPIATDNEFYTDVVSVPANVSPASIITNVLRARPRYKGVGQPTAFCTEDVLTDLLLIEDKMGRRKYDDEADLARAMRVKEFVPVEVMDGAMTDDGDLLMVLVNLSDYVVGTDKGGQISTFEDFDIDFNQHKYLIEGRMSGALMKHKRAQVVVRQAGTLVSTTSGFVPTFNESTGVVTIPSKTGVTYKNMETDATLTAGAQPALAAGESLTVMAIADAGYYFPHNIDTDWEFTRPA